MSDHKGAILMLPSLPPAKALLGDKGYDSNQLRQALAVRVASISRRMSRVAAAAWPCSGAAGDAFHHGAQTGIAEIQRQAGR